MKLTGGVILDAEFGSPWCIKAQVAADDCRPYMDVPLNLIAYHYVLEGNFFVEVEGQASLEAGPGHLLVLPQNDPHLLGSDTSIPPVDVSQLIFQDPDSDLPLIRCEGEGRKVRILCGFLGSDDACDPLLSNLPPIIALPLDRTSVGSWVEGSMRYAAEQLMEGGAGASASLARLAELLLTEAIRNYIKLLPADKLGWLSGVRDPLVGKALALIHSQLSRSWSLSELAQETASSRSVLSERFSLLIGTSPINYHRRRRLEYAADRLTHTTTPIATIAFDVGYSSESAFSRSFKRVYGASPGAFRNTLNKTQ